MTILDWTEGEVPFGEMSDANGTELINVLMLDTETGEYDYYPKPFELLPNGDLKFKTGFAAVPIKFSLPIVEYLAVKGI